MARGTLVLDASAAIYVASAAEPPPGLQRFALFAPPIFPSERTSAVSAAVYRGVLPESAVDELFDRLESMAVQIIDEGRAHRRAAFDLARSLGWANTCDAEYVVLAQRRACPLLTTDARLERGARHLVDIRRPTSIVE